MQCKTNTSQQIRLRHRACNHRCATKASSSTTPLPRVGRVWMQCIYWAEGILEKVMSNFGVGLCGMNVNEIALKETHGKSQAKWIQRLVTTLKESHNPKMLTSGRVGMDVQMKLCLLLRKTSICGTSKKMENVTNIKGLEKCLRIWRRARRWGFKHPDKVNREIQFLTDMSRSKQLDRKKEWCIKSWHCNPGSRDKVRDITDARHWINSEK